MGSYKDKWKCESFELEGKETSAKSRFSGENMRHGNEEGLQRL